MSKTSPGSSTWVFSEWTPSSVRPSGAVASVDFAVAGVVDHDPALAEDLKGPVGPDPDRGRLVDADTEQLRVLEDHRDEPVVAAAGDEVLVDDDARERDRGPPRARRCRRR